MTLDEALAGLDVPADIRATLALVEVPYRDFEGSERRGQLIVHAELAEEVRAIFAELYELRFPIERIVPLAAYAWDDEASMQDNNTSAFNYRVIYGTDRLSNHSLGRAIDINTRINPYIARDGTVHPKGASYDPSLPGVFTTDHPATKAFLERGWVWGGNWSDRKDYQHFEKLP